MKLRTINLFILSFLAPTLTSTSVVSCKKPEKVSLQDAVKTKDLGYISELTNEAIREKFLFLNPDLQLTKKNEIDAIYINYDRATFWIHPAYKNKSKYKGRVEVNFSSFIKPLYRYDNENKCVVHLNKNNRIFRAEFAITKDFPHDEFAHGFSETNEFLRVEKEESESIMAFNFELNETMIDTKIIGYWFEIGYVTLPYIEFNIN